MLLINRVSNCAATLAPVAAMLFRRLCVLYMYNRMGFLAHRDWPNPNAATLTTLLGEIQRPWRVKEHQYFISFHAPSNPWLLNSSASVSKMHLQRFDQNIVSAFFASILSEFFLIFAPPPLPLTSRLPEQVSFQFCASVQANNFISSLWNLIARSDCRFFFVFFCSFDKLCAGTNEFGNTVSIRWMECGRVENAVSIVMYGGLNWIYICLQFEATDFSALATFDP